MASNSGSNGGIGVAGVLGIIFVCAKIFGFQPIASWSWIWVLSPFWIGFVVVMSIWLLFAIIALVIAAIASIK